MLSFSVWPALMNLMKWTNPCFFCLPEFWIDNPSMGRAKSGWARWMSPLYSVQSPEPTIHTLFMLTLKHTHTHTHKLTHTESDQALSHHSQHNPETNKRMITENREPRGCGTLKYTLVKSVSLLPILKTCGIPREVSRRNARGSNSRGARRMSHFTGGYGLLMLPSKRAAVSRARCSSLLLLPQN